LSELQHGTIVLNCDDIQKEVRGRRSHIIRTIEQEAKWRIEGSLRPPDRDRSRVAKA